MEKAPRETQTLRAGCMVEPKLFAPPQTPFPGAQDRQNLISWRRSLPATTTQFGEDRCMQFRVVVVTDTARPPVRPPARPPARPPVTDRTDYNTLARCKYDNL